MHDKIAYFHCRAKLGFHLQQSQSTAVQLGVKQLVFYINHDCFALARMAGFQHGHGNRVPECWADTTRGNVPLGFETFPGDYV